MFMFNRRCYIQQNNNDNPLFNVLSNNSDYIKNNSSNQCEIRNKRKLSLTETQNLLTENEKLFNTNMILYSNIKNTKEPSLLQAYTRGTVIVFNGIILWGGLFSILGIGSYQIIGELLGIDVTSFPIDVLTYSFLIGASLGVSRGILSAVEFGLIRVNILKNLTTSYINWTLPENKHEFFSCNIQENFGADEMKTWLASTAPLDTYKKYLMPVWHKINIVNEIIYNIEPNLKAIDTVIEYRSADVPVLDKDLLCKLVFPHTEVALFHLFQVKKQRTTVFTFTLLGLCICTMLFTSFIKNHLPVISHFVSIYDKLKEDGIVSSNHPVKAYFRDSLITVLGLVAYLIENL